MERAGAAWLTPRPGCPVKLDDGTVLRTGDRIAADDPIAQKYRHRLMVLSAAPDPVRHGGMVTERPLQDSGGCYLPRHAPVDDEEDDSA